MNAVKENVFLSEAEEGERMIGKCSPCSTGFYTVESAVMISLSTRQIWNFKYALLNSKPVVKVNRDNVRLYLSKEEFEEDWKIIEKAEG